jgi:RNA polymerase sigma-70 factor (ECF subfamily)
MDGADQSLVEQARAGNPDAFRLLVERHARSIHRLACRMLGDESIAEDAVQETFLRAYRQLHRYELRSSFSTWLYRITANRCIDMLRGRERIAEARPEPVEAGLGPHALAVATEVRSSLRAALRHLTHQERAAFLLRHYEGCSIEQVAEVLDVSQAAAKNSVFRAVQKLRGQLAGRYR